MAFTYVPKNEKELRSKAIFRNTADMIVNLLEYLAKTNPSVKDPIALDPTAPTKVKITRRLSGMDLKKIKKETGAEKLTMAWGEGSRKVGGKIASPNKGIQFEKDLVRDINLYIQGESIRDAKNNKFIKEFVNYYKLTMIDEVKEMGALNQKRPLKFTAKRVYIGGSNFEIGSTVTDVTVETTSKAGQMKKGRTIYLSLKYGKTVTFANPGVATLMPERDFKAGKFVNPNTKALLSMLGLDEKRFIDTFNAYAENKKMNKFSEDVTNKMDKMAFQEFLKSGIGYGYHMVHLLGQNIKHKEMTREYLTQASRVNKAIAYYGGMSGGGSGPVTAKRIDIIITTPIYKFKLNIRNKQGGGKVYPGNLMIDYEYI